MRKGKRYLCFAYPSGTPSRHPSWIALHPSPRAPLCRVFQEPLLTRQMRMCRRPGRAATEPFLLRQNGSSVTRLSPALATRTKSSRSPCSHGRGWGAASWMAAPSSTGRSWCWSGSPLSSTAPCTAARPRTRWAPPTPTPGSSCSVRRRLGGGRPPRGGPWLTLSRGGGSRKGPRPLNVP